jgi:tRNA threonylcarbamoyladenosine biosynthesis protein TsaB
LWILSIDTATKITGLALHQDEQLVAESFLHTSKTHSERVMPMILQLMENAGLSFSDLNAVAVASGPGSFTGLRIGMATAKGIAQVRNLPVIGVNTLDALAQNGLGFTGLISPILDARKNEVYNALYRNQHGMLERVSEYRAIAPEKLLEELSVSSESVLFVGDAVATYQGLIATTLAAQAVFFAENMSLPRGSQVGGLAAKRLALGESDDLYGLKPFYIRQSEAEVTWAKRFGQGV